MSIPKDKPKFWKDLFRKRKKIDIDNLIINTLKQIQVLDSRAFFHKEH